MRNYFKDQDMMQDVLTKKILDEQKWNENEEELS